jgi:hypothetical protein
MEPVIEHDPPPDDAEAFLAALDAVNGPRPARPQLHPDRCRERATRELEGGESWNR